MNEEQQNIEDTASDYSRMRRFSLRRVLMRFCNDSGHCPESLFLKDITVSTNCIGSGSASDIYSAQSSSGEYLAVKTYRVFEREQGSKRFSEVSNVCFTTLHYDAADVHSGSRLSSHPSVPFETPQYSSIVGGIQAVVREAADNSPGCALDGASRRSAFHARVGT